MLPGDTPAEFSAPGDGVLLPKRPPLLAPDELDRIVAEELQVMLERISDAIETEHPELAPYRRRVQLAE